MKLFFAWLLIVLGAIDIIVLFLLAQIYFFSGVEVVEVYDKSFWLFCFFPGMMSFFSGMILQSETK